MLSWNESEVSGTCALTSWGWPAPTATDQRGEANYKLHSKKRQTKNKNKPGFGKEVDSVRRTM